MNFNPALFLCCRYVKYSRRQWDGLIKAWKLQIHAWNAKGDDPNFSIGEWKADQDILKDDNEADSIPQAMEKNDNDEEPSSFNWCEEVEEEEELLKRRKMCKKS